MSIRNLSNRKTEARSDPTRGLSNTHEEVSSSEMIMNYFMSGILLWRPMQRSLVPAHFPFEIVTELAQDDCSGA